MFVLSNIGAMRTLLNLKRLDSAYNDSLARLSSGLNLPKPSFGGGLYGVANDMEALYLEYTTGAANVEDALGFLEIAQTAMLEVNDVLLEMNDLAHRAASGLLNPDQRQELDAAFQELKNNISDIRGDVRYNDLPVWSTAGAGTDYDIVVGENQLFTVSTYNLTSAALLYGTLSLGTAAAANTAMAAMANAINQISRDLARIGAQVGKVQAKANILKEQAVQQKAMRARIMELDYAKEMKNLISLQVMLQIAYAMAAQANLKPRMVLQMFG